MKKALKEELVSILKHQHTDKLQSIKSILSDWEYVHGKKQGSYFWQSPLKARERRRQEEYYSRDSALVIGQYTIHYDSSVYMSAQHVYWTDSLYFAEGSDEHLSFGDVTYLQDAIESIISDRKAKTKATA